MFHIDNYIDAEANLETPEDVVLACIRSYKKWSSDCMSWAKRNRDKVSELTKGPAKICHLELRKRYCAPLNRQWHRSHSGYYFLGGIVEAKDAILKSEALSDREVLVYTAFSNNRNKTLKFHLVRQGRRWAIKSLQSDDGNGKWCEEFL